MTLTNLPAHQRNTGAPEATVAAAAVQSSTAERILLDEHVTASNLDTGRTSSSLLNSET